ncbi:MAG: hypothetical protein ABIR57_09625, partial [Aeromicrobium sp.]
MHSRVKGVRPHHVIADIWLANFVGSMILLAEYLYVLPFPDEASGPEVTRANVILSIICILISWAVLAVVGGTMAHRALDWTVRDDDPDECEQHLTLYLPWRLFQLQVVMWAISC